MVGGETVLETPQVGDEVVRPLPLTVQPAGISHDVLHSVVSFVSLGSVGYQGQGCSIYVAGIGSAVGSTVGSVVGG